MNVGRRWNANSLTDNCMDNPNNKTWVTRELKALLSEKGQWTEQSSSMFREN